MTHIWLVQWTTTEHEGRKLPIPRVNLVAFASREGAIQFAREKQLDTTNLLDIKVLP